MKTNPVLEERALALLARFYGYRSFRAGQFEIIDAVCSGRDAVVLMPTGGGKSLCYQLPAMLMDGCAIVVSPLIALMQDQVQGLVSNGIPAAGVHSNQPEDYNRRVLDAAFSGKIKLLYISPERLLTEIDTFGRLKVSLVAVDEAHCISQWGHDFRPVYTDLARIKEQLPGVPVMALTATADRLTRDDIIAQLRLSAPYCFLGSFDRPNISLKAYSNPGKKERLRFIMNMERKYPQDSGVVYCLSRKGAEDTNEALKALGVRTVCYHAGMTPAARDAAMQDFLSGRVNVVCATIAFGMGIDKSNIRWVIHNNLPGNIESYYQEIGRAGRDGMPAEAVLFYSYGDLITRRSFVDESGQKAINKEKLDRMLAYAEARVCRRRILLSYFSEERACDCGNCDNCTNPPKRFDGTIEAQKALSAVLRTREAIGLYTTVNILRGALRADIRREGYDRLPTFGVGSEIPQDEWVDYINQMVQLGVFEIAYDKGNRLKATPYGMKILRGQEKLVLSEYVPPETAKNAKSKKAPAPAVSQNPEEQLFGYLKTVRSDIARMENVPPYIIFTDATLMDMAKRQPATIDDMLQVSGVGEKKAVKYGRRFIREVRKFQGLSASEGAGTSLKETLILFNAGCTVQEIADTKNIKPDTVYSHFAQLIDRDLITAYHAIISADDFKTISSEISSNPTGYNDVLKERYRISVVTVVRSILAAIERKREQMK
ncbi:MAG: DNA helicase RecQ [Muribaculaceae bacterium]|nr:DNA helicase RecQ [Muribaculaceae bacterium]